MDIGCPDITLTCLIYRDLFLYNFLTNNSFLINIHKSLMYNSYTLFTFQNILKLDYSNIFYKNASQWLQPSLLHTHGLKGALSSRVPETGSHDGVSKAQ